MSIQVTDVIPALSVVAAAAALSPVYYDLINQVRASAGPLESVLLELFVPTVMLAVIISVGVSASRRWGSA